MDFIHNRPGNIFYKGLGKLSLLLLTWRSLTLFLVTRLIRDKSFYFSFFLTLLHFYSSLYHFHRLLYIYFYKCLYTSLKFPLFTELSSLILRIEYITFNLCNLSVMYCSVFLRSKSSSRIYLDHTIPRYFCLDQNSLFLSSWHTWKDSEFLVWLELVLHIYPSSSSLQFLTVVYIIACPQSVVNRHFRHTS